MLFVTFLWMVMSMINGSPCGFVDDPIAYIPWIAMEIGVAMPYLVAIAIMLAERFGFQSTINEWNEGRA